MTEFKPIKEGKVREIYDNGDSLIMVATDRISAFDVILKNKVTKKGTVLTQMSKFWFDYTRDLLPNHMLSVDVQDMPEFFRQPQFTGNSMMCRKLTMLPIECIVRGYITGSGWASYQKTGKVCGIQLPEGLQESDKLPEPIYTPSTKAEIGDHDENISYEQSIDVLEKQFPGHGLEYATKLRDYTIALYKKCAEYALSRGIIIADTKFEFGVIDGKVTLKGFNSATAGQQPRINAAGTALEWYTPDTSTVSGLADTVAGHTQDIQNLQTGKADKATTLEGYGITDAMTATAIAEAIQTAIAATGHASFKKVGTVPTAAEAQDNVLYLVMNADTGFYDIYAKVENEVVRLDDVSVNLDGYSTTEQMNEAIATAIANKVDKVDGKGLSTEDFTTALKEKLVALPDDAEANFVKSVSDEFTVSAEGKLEVKEVAQAKVTGLPDALAGKVDKVEGKGLSTNDFTDEAKAKLDGVEAGANQNLIEIVKLNGAALDISEKAVNIPVAGATAGVVTSSADENKVAVAEDGSMEVNSLNMSKLVQSEGDTLILDGGNASV